MIRHILLVAISLVVVACQSSPPRHYYVLSPSSPTSSSNEQAITELVGIGPIEVADYLNRLNIVSMNSDNALELSKTEFWAEPLEEGIVRILALNLTQKNPSRMMQIFPWRSDSIPTYSFRIYIQELFVISNQAKINVTWELIDTASKKVIERQNFISSIKKETKPDSTAKAYSQLLSQLSDKMNEALVKVE